MGFCAGEYKNNSSLKPHKGHCGCPQLTVLTKCHGNLFIYLKISYKQLQN